MTRPAWCTHPASAGYKPASAGKPETTTAPTRDALAACLSRVPRRVARTVLRGQGRGNAPLLPDWVQWGLPAADDREARNRQVSARTLGGPAGPSLSQCATSADRERRPLSEVAANGEHASYQSSWSSAAHGFK